MRGQRVGYIRVSSVDQNTQRQLDGVPLDRVFTDKASGKDTDRPQLIEAMNYLREGDELYVHSMDRLARNVDDLRSTVKQLIAKGVRVSFVKEGHTFTRKSRDNPMANLMLNILGSVAEFERAIILERQREGIAAAKARGVYKGRSKKLDDDTVAKIRADLSAGAKKAVLAREHHVSRETLYRYLRNATSKAPTKSHPAKTEPPRPKVAKLRILLEYIPFSKHVRTAPMKQLVEQQLLTKFLPRTIRPGSEYELTVGYKTHDEIHAAMADLWEDISRQAEYKRCTVEGEIYDNHGQTWGDGSNNKLEPADSF